MVLSLLLLPPASLSRMSLPPTHSSTPLQLDTLFGTNLLDISVWRDFGALKGLRDVRQSAYWEKGSGEASRRDWRTVFFLALTTDLSSPYFSVSLVNSLFGTLQLLLLVLTLSHGLSFLFVKVVRDVEGGATTCFVFLLVRHQKMNAIAGHSVQA